MSSRLACDGDVTKATFHGKRQWYMLLRHQIHAKRRSSDVRARYSWAIETNGQEWFLHAQAEVTAPQWRLGWGSRNRRNL